MPQGQKGSQGTLDQKENEALSVQPGPKVPKVRSAKKVSLDPEVRRVCQGLKGILVNRAP